MTLPVIVRDEAEFEIAESAARFMTHLLKVLVSQFPEMQGADMNYRMKFATATRIFCLVVMFSFVAGGAFAGFLGIDYEEKMGIVVLTEVIPNSPAAEHGLMVGDAVVEYDGKKITNPDKLIRTIRELPAGTRCHLGILREGQMLNFNIPLWEKAGMKSKDRVKQMEGTFLGFEEGDYVYWLMRGSNGAERSFSFDSRTPSIARAYENPRRFVGKKCRVGWITVNVFIPEAGKKIDRDTITTCEWLE